MRPCTGLPSWGGDSGAGTVFAINTNGTGFRVLYNFKGEPSDGDLPNAAFLSGDTLYGTTASGGSSGNGMWFSIKTNGLDYTAFTPSNSYAALVSSNYTLYGGTVVSLLGLVSSTHLLYGITFLGGNSNLGSIFSLSFPPKLSLLLSGPDLIQSWPTNFADLDYSGYTLQTTTNLTSPVWVTSSVAPVIVNGQYTVTNPISGTQQFFRLSR